MRILILGGTGAMGVSLVKILATCIDNEIFVTSRKTNTSTEQVHYIQGNAKDAAFLSTLLKGEKYDAIVDFMIYTPQELSDRIELLLSSTKQYVFLSSSRVYADTGESCITENATRLLDVSNDKEYLAGSEYALEKAREENILFESKCKNWTIIRPYITYNDERLQLGVMEKEGWLYRALLGKKIVFSKDIADKYTTITHGDDVAMRIAGVLGLDEAMGETFHIASEYSLKWSQILDIYVNAIEQSTGKRPEVHWVDNAEYMRWVTGNVYQVKYDRLYNRRFNSNKIERVCGQNIASSGSIFGNEYILPMTGLTQCIDQFIKNGYNYKKISWALEGYHDRFTKDKSLISSIQGKRNKIVYLLYRYAPVWMLKVLRKIRNCISLH